jgi:hypothetical protein
LAVSLNLPEYAMATQLLTKAVRSKTNPAVRHRLAIRYHPGPDTTCGLFTSIGKQSLPCPINDISISGVSICVDDEIPEGSYVVLELRNTHRDFCRLVQLKVLRVNYRSDGSTIISGIFTKQLSYDELQLLR